MQVNVIFYFGNNCTDSNNVFYCETCNIITAMCGILVE